MDIPAGFRTIRKTPFSLGLLLWVLGTGPSAWGREASGTPHEIQVELFGQPCSMGGPFSEDTLQNIHLISPERVDPVDSIEGARRLLKQVRGTSDLPEELKSYQKKLTDYLLALESFQVALKAPSPEKFLQNIEIHIHGKTGKDQIRAKLKKINWVLKTKEEMAALQDVYVNFIPVNPEADFHRAIRKLGIRYFCRFD